MALDEGWDCKDKQADDSGKKRQTRPSDPVTGDSPSAVHSLCLQHGV